MLFEACLKLESIKPFLTEKRLYTFKFKACFEKGLLLKYVYYLTFIAFYNLFLCNK